MAPAGEDEDEPAADRDDAKEVECREEVEIPDLKERKCSGKRKSRKVTQEQVLEEQYKALLLKQENLKLKKRTRIGGGITWGKGKQGIWNGVHYY